MEYKTLLWAFLSFCIEVTSDRDGKFAFIRQPQAMAVNIAVLGQTMEKLIAHVCGDDKAKTEEYCDRLKKIAESEFEEFFMISYLEMQRAKLGLTGDGEGESSNLQLYKELEMLMHRSRCDFTILFRLLSAAASAETPEDALQILAPGFYDFDAIFKSKPAGVDSGLDQKNPDSEVWYKWLTKYLERVKAEGQDRCAREATQLSANPKFVLRNWMSIMAYEDAEKGDYSVLRELEQILQNPYDEQSEEISLRWFRRTPEWAEGMPGSSFLS